MVVLGDAVGDVPRHHMSMYAAVLGDVALVGDPEEGARIVGPGFEPGELGVERGEPLRADVSGADHGAVRARRAYPQHGTVGCLVNVLAREPV